MNVQDLINEGIELFENKEFDEAIEKLNQALDGIEDKNSQIQEKNDIQFWLGRCYFEQAMKAKGKESEQLFGQAAEHFQQSLEFAEKLEDENGIQEQISTQKWLGFCYTIQMIQAKGDAADELFGKAIKHFQQYFYLAKQLGGKNSIQEQSEAESMLGICYFERAIKVETEVAAEFEQNDKHCQQQLELSKKLLPSVQEKWDKYFEWKEQKIQRDLFQTQEGDLVKAITTILAVLNILPMELGLIPLAHYTSPFVCEKLFGIDSDQTSPMRMGSSTYMNDPTEGEGLMELLNLQDLELENKADCPVYNAFFICFSSRVNDLNQFRLYGKDNGVEASGCCLVFNKTGRWLEDSNVSESFRRLTEAEVSDLLAVNLPLYQVAYIAYKDEYIAEEKCRIWLPNKDNPKFGIRLKSFGNKGWHECRIGKLEEALKQLIKIFKGKANINDEDKKALEYIRYLFKDFAFRDEEEFRLLKIEQIGSDEIEYCEATKSIYLPYADVRNMVDEVILGTNYEKSGNHRKAEVFQHLMRKHYPNVKVSRSSLPINANPPITKN